MPLPRKKNKKEKKEKEKMKDKERKEKRLVNLAAKSRADPLSVSERERVRKGERDRSVFTVHV